MEGLGTDEQPMIDILAHRTGSQRQEIALSYKTQFGQDLIEDLKSELSGNFEDALVALLTPLTEYLASELNKALSGLGTKEDTLIEILCTRRNDEIKAITETYERLFERSLEDDIKSDTSGDFERLMVSMTTAGREEGPADPDQARTDAEALHEAGVEKWGTDESTFNSVMCSRSYPHLRRVFWEYEQIAGQSILDAIDSEMSGDLKTGMLTLAKCVDNIPLYFAEKLHKAIEGAGTEDQVLVRIITTRCEIDMIQIKHEYKKLYDKSLEEAVSDDTSGDYRKLLVTLVEDI
ncbi:annexin A4-like [Limulus polyphemus]|uniref:Annexin n=1 Tax=Limulus polyphemus TaxID=6850 RepID=A0ABM1BSM9_LIMPO|nr:annexin A4-like [Limulus polyphemus]